MSHIMMMRMSNMQWHMSCTSHIMMIRMMM